MLAEEIISVLASDPQADIRVTVEISAEFPNGVSEQSKELLHKTLPIWAALKMRIGSRSE